MMDSTPASGPSSHDFVPGTLHLVTLGGQTGGEGSNADIVLHPQPSDDPEDPLNWTYRRKLLSTFCMFTYAMTIAIASACIYSVLEPISQATNLSVANLNSGTGYMFLSFGWGCLVWQPLGLAYGKRPVYLFTTLCTMIIMLWAPFTTSNGQWIANKTLQGFFGAPLEALCEISMTDIWFAHERGKYLTLYVLALYIANSIAPLIAGFIAAGMEWKWVLYWCAIYNAVSLIFLYFFMEETNYTRSSSASEDTSDLTQTLKSKQDDGKFPSYPYKPASAEQQLTKHTGSKAKEAGHTDLEREVSQSQGIVYTPRTFMDKLKILDMANLKEKDPKNMIGQVIRPFFYLRFPVVVFCGISIGCYQMWLSFLNGTESMVMTDSYHLSTVMLGVPYISPIIGAVFGYLYAGLYGDKFIVKIAHKNKGVYEPEQRLWLLLPLILLAPGSQLLWGLGAYYEVHWIGPIIAMGIISFVTVVGVQVCVSYCIDSYRALSGEAIVTVILLRNNILFGVNYGITPWVNNMGLQDAYIVAACLAFAQVVASFIMIKWGKSFRAGSVNLYFKYCQQLQESGLVH
ncbi:major facilitator superfamily domain-containing protein [Aspergillus varians]